MHILRRSKNSPAAEIERTKASLETARLDSRPGYECEMDYIYSPFILKEKLQVMYEIQDEQLPRYKNKLGVL